MNEYTLHHGDCLETLRTMPDNSVDAIVTDPPYGLSFMGKKWDYDVPATEVWVECLRVLKPGGHLLAFAGTRTQHRMCVRIEDAGFEIRDMIAWVYGAGFPKSHNLDNHRGDKICGCPQPYTQDGSKQKTQCDVRSVRCRDVSASVNACTERCKVLQSCVPQQGSHQTVLRAKPKEGCDGGVKCGMEGRCNASSPARQLCAGSLCASPCVDCADGACGRLRNGAPHGDGVDVRLPADADRVRASCGSQPAEQCERQSGAVAGQSESQTVGAWPVCGGCGLPMVPRGFGTSLKPALEPITVARKPLTGTVVSNVLAWGTGGLNIDGCRIGTGEDRTSGGPPTKDPAGYFTMGGGWANTNERATGGRWPANLILQDCPEVLAGFPETTSGKMKAGTPYPGGNVYGAPSGETKADTYGDTGSAARFFYTAKASAEDRDAGLHGFDVLAAGGLNGRNTGSLGSVTMRANTHATVKPTDLMRYLCRLVTPPGGIVLDPFNGSGSTGKACMLEGFQYIGCELSTEYIEISRARIEHAIAMRKAGAEVLKPATDRDPHTVDLFGAAQ